MTSAGIYKYSSEILRSYNEGVGKVSPNCIQLTRNLNIHRIKRKTRRRGRRAYRQWRHRVSEMNTSNLIQINIENNNSETKIPFPISNSFIKIGLFNAHSVNNKDTLIKDFVIEENIDLLVICETWLKDNDVSTAWIDTSQLVKIMILYYIPELTEKAGV
jgi:hypothetical protein